MKSRKLRCLRTFPLFLVLMIAFIKGAEAQTAPPSPLDWSYRYAIVGTRMLDGQEKTVMTGDSYAYWVINHHCNNEFLFTVYKGEQVKLNTYFVISPADRLLYTPHYPYPIEFECQVKLNGVDLYPASRKFEEADYVITADQKGYYEVTYTSEIASDGVHRDVIKARFLVIDKVETVSVEPETFCSATHPVGDDFKFNVITTPSLETICPVQPKTHPVWGGSIIGCTSASDLQMKMSFEDMLTASAAVDVYHFLGGSAGPWVPRNNIHFGTSYSGYPAVWPTTWGDEKKYFFKNSELLTYYDGAMPVFGKVKFFDGLSTTKQTKIFFSLFSPANSLNNNNTGAFLIWEYNKTAPHSISGHTAGPWGTIDAPAQETWTPTDNPLVNEGFGTNVPVIGIHNKLVIGKGQSLTLNNMILEMGKDAQIIVESDPAGILPAGMLNLYNSTIRGAGKDCGNEDLLWSGIVLQGNGAQPQTPIGGDYYKRKQAMLYMTNSTISDAEVAVRTYEPSVMTRTGGIVVANNSTFKNNLLAIDYQPYPTLVSLRATVGSYVNSFYSCKFIANDPNIANDFKGFVQAVDVRGLQFQNCNFTADFGSTMRGFGIKSTSCGVTLFGDPSTARGVFKGLQYGVQSSQAAFGTLATLNVRDNKFTANYTGIHTGAMQNINLYNNVLEVPQKPSSGTFFGRNTSGVNIETGSGYTVTNNIFRNTVGGTYSGGANAVLVWNSGGYDNVIRSNDVLNLNQGMIANYNNKSKPASIPYGLQFLCNRQSSNVGTAIAALGANPAVDGMRELQGEASLPAGNTFAHLTYDIYNPSTQVGPVTYYYKAADPMAEPTLKVGSVFTSSTSFADGCPAFPDKPYPIVPLSTDGKTGILLHEAILTNIEYYGEHFELANRSTQLHYWLGQMGDAYSDLARVDLYMNDGDVIAANALYTGIASTRSLVGAEAYEFTHWGNMLLSISTNLMAQNKTAVQLSATQIDTLELVADSAGMWAKVRAQNWLNSYDGRVYANAFLYPEAGGNTARRTMEEAVTGSQANAVYPNPAGNYIDIAYTALNDQSANIVMELKDVLGKTMLSQSLGKNGVQRIGLDQVPTGMYFYTIKEDNSITLSGKLLKK